MWISVWFSSPFVAWHIACTIFSVKITNTLSFSVFLSFHTLTINFHIFITFIPLVISKNYSPLVWTSARVHRKTPISETMFNCPSCHQPIRIKYMNHQMLLFFLFVCLLCCLAALGTWRPQPRLSQWCSGMGRAQELTRVRLHKLIWNQGECNTVERCFSRHYRPYSTSPRPARATWLPTGI